VGKDQSDEEGGAPGDRVVLSRKFGNSSLSPEGRQISGPRGAHRTSEIGGVDQGRGRMRGFLGSLEGADFVKPGFAGGYLHNASDRLFAEEKWWSPA
jgi:hypothetical protein